MRLISFILLLLIFIAHSVRAQDVEMSPPQKVNTGVSKIEVLGRTDQGILIRHTQKDDDEIAAFYDNMQPHWRKKIPLHDKASTLQQIITYPDSLAFFYTTAEKGITTLYAFKTSSRIEPPAKVILCDTISRNFLNPLPSPQFSFTNDKRFILVWFTDPNYENNHLVHLECRNNTLKLIWMRMVKIDGLDHPEILDAVIDTAGDGVLVCGNYKDRNIQNDFPYVALSVVSVRNSGQHIQQQIIKSDDVLYSECIAKPDALTGDVVIGGLYAHAIGTQSSGFYLLKYSAATDTVNSMNYQPHTTEFLAQLTGSPTPKRNDGFYDFVVKDLIVKRDGGAVLTAESQSTSSESFSTPGLGGFGFSNGFVVNSYHYDDIAVISFKPGGQTEWKTILHKKQATEGDGGFYSSYALMIARSQAYLFYNDQLNGQAMVSYYTLDKDGNQKRNDLFNAERKGVMLAMRQAKQISANEIVIPSFKRNFLQFVKITY